MGRSLALLGLALAACGDDDTSVDDAFASSQVSEAIDGNAELSRLLTPLESTPDLVPLTDQQARAQKIQDARDKFRSLVGNPLCVTFDTDNDTFLVVTFDRCRVALVIQLDGSLRGDLAIETAGAERTLVTTVSIPSLTIAGLRTRTVTGGFELRHPIAGGEVAFDGDLAITNDTGELALTASATWQVTNTCVAFTAGAQLSGDALGALGPIALSVENLAACRNQCPTAGDVELSYGRGTLLAWSYGGASTVTVEGPRGKQLDVELACGGDGG